MATIDTLLKIRADASQAVRGLKPLQTSLEETAKDAQVTEQALQGLDGTHNIHVNDAEVEAARGEVERLRNMMREQLRADVNADTSEAEARIKKLQRTIKVLDQQQPTVEVVVEADTSGLSGLQQFFPGIGGGGREGGGIAGAVDAASSSLGIATTALKGFGLAGAASVTGIGAATLAIYSFGQQAADVETTISQLDALTQGLGVETFAQLQEFAKTTPFALDEVTASTSRLVAAGVELEDIPDTLHDLGNVAAATPATLEQIATIFSQMVSKGKASYEELAQLAEAGIGVWPALSEALKLPIADVQKLATEGKLGADAILLLREKLNTMYPTAMQDQAETFNGKMSTFLDTLSQTRQEVGAAFLPMMKILLEDLTDLAEAALWTGEKLGWLGDKFTEMSEKGAAAHDDNRTTIDDIYDLGLATAAWEMPGKFWEIATNKPDWFPGEDEKRQTDGVKNSIDSAGISISGLADKVIAGFQTGEEAVAEFEAAIKAAEDAVKAAADAFADIGGSVRTTVDFIISQDDLEEEIQATLKGVKAEDMPPVDLPANLRLGELAGLGDRQQELVGMVSEFVQTGLTEGARRAEIVPGFDEDAWYAQVRKDTRGLLIDAGIDPKNANKVLGEVFGLPRKVPTDADVSGAKDDLARLNGTEVEIKPKLPKPTPLAPPSALEEFTKDWAKNLGIEEETPAPIVPKVDQGAVKDTNAAIGNVAKPNGSARVAPVRVQIDPVSLMNAFFTLAALTATQTKTIKIHFEENPTGDTINPANVNALLGASRTLTVAAPAGAAGPTATKQPGRQLAPKQAPVQVLLDGAEISSRLDLRRSLAAVESVRRTA